MKPIYCLLVLLAANTAMAAQPLSIDFSVGDAADYFTAETADRVSPAAGDAAAMQLSDATVQLQDVTVLPARSYSLRLVAAFAGDAESIEENPRFEIFHQLGQTSLRLPSREIRFYDAAGKPTGRPLMYALPYRKTHQYQDLFYTPADAATARIRLSSGKDLQLTLSQLVLEPTDNDGTLNLNPAFELGPDNYSGWQNIAAGGKFIQREGKTILDTKYGSTGQRIPLQEPGTYAFSALATGNGYNSVVIVRVYDADDKELMRSSTRRYGPRTYFVPPPEAAYLSLLVYSCLLEEVRLVRVGDEDAINAVN
ncbi:hypothetical protein [Roseimaritima ulvae]|uniref:DUF4397 domain-containing protein n=1 Tax=Roseimaritima ulvae TaxID=980254 RepID=A0A5B9QYW4_9BACT|nr:hypothetical protein [Roseimaritima ulvae]QEG42595.1 hypothetical protein UC8_46370 [Roseimaritima ulvae]